MDRTLLAVLLLATAGIGDAPAAGTEWCSFGSLAAPTVAPSPLSAEATSSTHTLALFYAVPTDVPNNPAVVARIKRAAADIQAWYQCATGGLTWEFAYPETVRTYNAQHNRQYYLNNGNWWGSLLGEMGSDGLPIWTSGYVCGIWAHGAGFWAGAAQSCGVDCGTALLGVELFPEFNNPAYSGGSCPGGAGGAAWPCTPEGAFVHELGHTLGLPHPLDVPATNGAANRSVMQTHWNYPDYAPPNESPWGFLTLERVTIASSPFMKSGVALRQTHSSCDVVNLPTNGLAPTASFVPAISSPAVFSATNTSSGASRYYWTFGDSTGSNAVDAYHAYVRSGSYPVNLRVSAANGMMSFAASQAVVGVIETASLVDAIALDPANPNPSHAEFTVEFRIDGAAVVDVALFSIDGRYVRTLTSGYRPAGRHALRWDGCDAAGARAPAGVYLCRLRAAGRVLASRLVMRP